MAQNYELTREQADKVTADAVIIGSAKAPEGEYVIQKISDKFIVIAPNSDGEWKPVTTKLKAGTSCVLLATVRSFSMSDPDRVKIESFGVNEAFKQADVEEYFKSEVDAKRRSHTEDEPLSKDEVDALLADVITDSE